MTTGVYVLSCRLTSAPLWLGIYLFLWWFLLVVFELFLLHWRYELPCQDKLPEFHSTPILDCIRILWLVSHPLGLGLDKALCGWNSVSGHFGSNTMRTGQGWGILDPENSNPLEILLQEFCQIDLNTSEQGFVHALWHATNEEE